MYLLEKSAFCTITVFFLSHTVILETMSGHGKAFCLTVSHQTRQTTKVVAQSCESCGDAPRHLTHTHTHPWKSPCYEAVRRGFRALNKPHSLSV